jgi:hypothetical protein
MDQERLFHPLKIKGVSSLPKGKDFVRRLDNVGLLRFGIPEKLSAL